MRNISATADLTLTNSQGQTASLDGALVACPPERARLRAWKFGSPVLDLTILPSGVWAFAVTSDGSPSTNLAGLPAAGISRSIEMLSGEYFAHARAEHLESTGEILVVLGTAFGREGVRCEIDRATLTPRRFVVPSGDTDLEIILDRYALIGDVAWAHRIEFRSPDGTIIIRLDDIELNGEIPENVFVPPSRATRIP